MSLDQGEHKLIQNFEHSLQDYKIFRLIQSVQLVYIRRINEAFSVMIDVDEQMLEREVADMVIFIYKIYKCMYDQNRRWAIYKLWKNNQKIKIQKEIYRNIEIYKNKSKILLSTHNNNINPRKISGITKRNLLLKGFNKLRPSKIKLQPYKKDQLKRLLIRKLVNKVDNRNTISKLEIRCILRQQTHLNIHKVWESKIITLAKRYLTKLYVTNCQKEPLQQKHEALGKMICYLNKAKRQENLKRQVFNRYVTTRYVDLSKAFLQIQQFPINVSAQTLLELKDEFNQTYHANFREIDKLGLNKLLGIISTNIRRAFRQIRIKAEINRINIAKDQPSKALVPSEAPIFANCLNQYLFLLGKISSQNESVKRRGITIFKIMMKRNQKYQQTVLKRYFDKFVHLIPQYSYEARMAMVNNIHYLENEKDDLLNRLTN